MKTTKNGVSSFATFRKMLRYLGFRKWLLLASLLCSAGSVVLILWLPLLAGAAIDEMTGAGAVRLERLSPIFLRIGLATAGAALLQWLLNGINNRLTYGIVHDIRADAFRKLRELPLRYLDRRPAGDVVSCIIADAEQLADGLLLGFSQLFTGIVTILGTMFFLFRISPKIALTVVLLTPLSLFAAKIIASRTHAMFTEQAAVRGKQTALAEEMIAGQRTVRAFAREAENARIFGAYNDRLERCSLRAIFFSSITNPTTRFVNALVYAAVALVGAWILIGGNSSLTVGDLSCLLGYANQYTKPFNEISGVITELQNATACAARLFALIEEPTQAPDAPGAATAEGVRGAVEMRDVCFSYTPERKLIQNLNLSVKAGQHVAIVGPTGCGKTTLINLLMRFYDPTSGEITLDGTPTLSLTRQSLRRQYGMVLQETWLHSGTIRENLAFGKPDATEEEIIAAAKAAYADRFIRQLPQGYDTVIGEDGGSLSQGQKQLLCIARILLTLPPVLILDEATSSIDTRTERRIGQVFDRLTKGRTAFLVAHRLSTIRNADVILVMRDGNVVEQGTHEALLQRGGFYATLYNSQFEA